MANPLWPDLSERHIGQEAMDSPTFSGNDLTTALRNLERINRYLGNYTAVRCSLNKFIATLPKDVSIHIVDMGCGGGDLICFMNNYLQRKKIEVRFTGLEINPHTIDRANKRLCNLSNVTYLQADVLAPDFKLPECDILVSSHFIYHFEDEQLTEFITKNINRIHLGFIFSELRRSLWSYALFATFGQLLFPGRVTIADGLIAIRRAFTRKELNAILRSDWPGIQIDKRPMFRQVVALNTNS